jgi:hypothetical protein
MVLTTFLVIVGVVVVGTAILGFVAPTDLNVEREVVINRPKDDVFNDLRLMKSHDSWSPWMRKDPNIVKQYTGTDGTVGFVQSWSGNNEVGVGEQEIKGITEGSRIDYELRFKKPMEDTSAAYLVTEGAGEGKTRVKWGMNGKSPFPRNVFCLLLNIKNKLGRDFDQGLADLKTRLEH